MAEIKITADTAQAERAISDLEKSLKSLEKISDAAAIGLGTITAAAAAMGVAVLKTLDAAGALVDTAKSLNISAQSLTYLQSSAQLAGIGADELNASLRRLQVSIGDALIKGTGPANDALNRLGISVGDIADLKADEQFNKIATALKDIPDLAERSALAVDLLGKQGPRLLEAAAATERLKKMFEDLGLAMSDIDYEALDQAGDAVDELKMIFSQGLKKAVAEIAPYIIVIIDNIKEAIKEAGGFEAIMENVKTVIKGATVVAISLFSYLAAAKFVAVAEGVITLTKAIRTMGLVAAASTAVATGGLSAILTLTLGTAGAIAAVVAAEKMFDKISAQAADKQAEIKKQVEETNAAQKQGNVQRRLYNQTQEKALEAFGKTLSNLGNQVKFEEEKLSLGEQQATINKIISEESEKLAAVGIEMNDQHKETVRLLVQQQFATKDLATTQGTLVKLADEITLLNEQDLSQRQVKQTLLAYERSVSKETYDINMASVAAYAKQVEQLKLANQLKNQEKNIKGQLGFDVDLLNQQEQMANLEAQIAQEKDANVLKAMRANLDKQKQLYAEQIAIRLAGSSEIGKIKLNEVKELNKLDQLEDEFFKVMSNNKIDIKKNEMAKILGINADLISELKAQGLDLDAQNLVTLRVNTQKQKIKTDTEIALNKQLGVSALELSTQKIRLMESEAELEASFHAASLAREKDLFGQRKFNEEQLKSIANERKTFMMKTDQEQYAFALGQAANMFTSLGSYNKKAFEASKAFNIANAIMNTYTGATKALATYPPPFNYIAAAATVAAGLAQVAAIRSQSYSGRALGGPVMNGQSYIVGERGPELFTPNTNGNITRNSDLPSGGGQTNINFTIVANDAQGFDDLLLQRRGMITQMVADAQMESGRRM